MSDSVLAYETAAARAAEAGLRRAQIDALARLAVPAWYLDPARGNEICEQAIEVSRAHGDPLLVAQTQLAAACFRLLYDAWRTEDAESCASARQTIRRLNGSSIPEECSAYVQAIQGDYEEALKQAEAGMMATHQSRSLSSCAWSKDSDSNGSGRFGELLRIVRTGRESAEKNGEDPWIFIFREAWLRALCFDFEGVLRVEQNYHAERCRAARRAAQGHRPWSPPVMSELDRGRYDEALQYFAQVRDPEHNAQISFFTGAGECTPSLGRVRLGCKLAILRTLAARPTDFLESALSIGRA